MFASIFRVVYVFALLLCSLLSVYLSAPVVLCSLCVLVALCGCVVVSFSLSVYTQKERARRVGASSLRVSWVCYIRINLSK